jgi:hypothetical protein
MDDPVALIVGSLLSGSVIAAVLGFVFNRQLERSRTIFVSTRAWKERSVSELLGPVYIQLDRTERAFRRYSGQNLFLEAKVLREGNLAVRDLLLAKADLIPPDLLKDAGELIEHYDRWAEEFERVRAAEKPDLDTPFVFVGPQGYPFPRPAADRFQQAFGAIWKELYADSAAAKPATEATSGR